LPLSPGGVGARGDGEQATENREDAPATPLQHQRAGRSFNSIRQVAPMCRYNISEAEYRRIAANIVAFMPYRFGTQWKFSTHHATAPVATARI